MKCTYCKSSVFIPEEGGPFNGGMTAEAKRAVDAIERSEAVDITSFCSAESDDSLDSASRPLLRKKITIMLTASVLLLAGVIIFLLQNKGGVLSQSFAEPALAFGQKGIGPGMLNDPRYAGVDREGNIYAGDYGDGRINVFDATGKFMRLITFGKGSYLSSMAVAPNGTLYLSYRGEIHRLDALGNDALRSCMDEKGRLVYLDSIALGADGSLVAGGHDERIVRFSPDGTVNLAIPRVFESVIGESEPNFKLAVDGLGNIYALGTINNLVLKYGPNGKYLDQFGGSNQHPAAGVDPGRFQAPDAIAVDGYGRVYVSDIWGIQVFDANGRFLKFFKVDGVAFGMAFDLGNNLFIASNKPAIITLRIQAP